MVVVVTGKPGKKSLYTMKYQYQIAKVCWFTSDECLYFVLISASRFHDFLNIDSEEAQMIKDTDKMYSKGSRLASEVCFYANFIHVMSSQVLHE